jgi:hypothetical protein
MIEVTLAEFIAKYEAGEVEDVVVVKDRIYGKERNYPSNVPSSQRPPFRVLFAVVP